MARGSGKSGAGGKIGPNEVLIFDLEIISLSEGGGGIWGLISTPILGPIAPWHLLLLAFMLFRQFGSGGGGKKVSARHILIKGNDGEAVCNELKAKLADAPAGSLEDAFGALAAQHSTCPSGKSGGSLGEFGPGQMVPAFDKVCWSCPVGEVQGPVQTGFGFHLILVTKRTDPAANKTE